MHLLPTAEQDEIAGTVRTFLSKEMPLTRLREFDDGATPVDRHFWKRCADQGWFGLGLSEAMGGVGYSVVEEVLLFREIGRAVTPGPFLSTVLGARLAAVAGAADIAAAILAGDAVVGLAEAHSDPAVGIGAAVSGSFDVLHGDGADYVLIADPLVAALVRRSDLAAGEAMSCFDATIGLERMLAVDVPTVAVVDSAQDAIHRRGTLLVSGVLAGIAEATRDLASEYAKVRVQFGRPIGVNQGVKHECAEMAVRADAATYQTFFAAVVLESAREDVEFHVATAKIMSSNSAMKNAASAVQLHGAMGYTYEHSAHRYVSRSHVYEQLFGNAQSRLEQLVRMPAPL